MHNLVFLRLLALFAIAVTASGCKTFPFPGRKSLTVNVPLENARTSDGYINSQTLSLGQVFLWDTQANTLTRLTLLTRDNFGNEVSVVSSELYTRKEASISSSTEMTFAGNTPLAPGVEAELRAAISRLSIVALSDYQSQGFLDPRFALNSKNLYSWRRSLAQDYPGPQYKFLFVSGVILGKEIELTMQSDGTAKIKGTVPQLGNVNLNVTYNGKASTKITSEKGTLVVNPQLFVLKAQGDRVGFEYDTRTRFDFQKLSNR